MKKSISFLIIIYTLNNYSQNATIDMSYGNNGFALFPDNFYDSSSSFSCMQSDGKIILNKTATNFNKVFRVNVDGSLDTTFGVNGYLDSYQNPSSLNESTSIAIQSDDKILGIYRTPDSYVISRCLPNGYTDFSFNGTGSKVVGFAYNNSVVCRFVKVQADGKILVCGGSGNLNEFFTMVRLNSNGSMDTTFGVGGVVQTTFSGQSSANCIALQPDGKIILGGYAENNPYTLDFAMIRYETNGNLDTTFGVGGRVRTEITPFNVDRINKIILQPDGKIIAAGNSSEFNSNNKTAAARYLPNGDLDTSFSDDGILITAYEFNCLDVILQNDGKIILINEFYPLRYNSDGSSDNVGIYGMLYQPYYNNGTSVFIQPDNKILILAQGGLYVNNQLNACTMIMRLNPGTLSIEQFSYSGVSVYPNPSTDFVKIDFKQMQQNIDLNIFNLLGQKISHKNIFQVQNLDYILPDAKGVYLLVIENENKEKLTFKIIKN